MTAPQQAREQSAPVASAHDKILIVDFGSQVTQLIARRVREAEIWLAERLDRCQWICPFERRAV